MVVNSSNPYQNLSTSHLLQGINNAKANTEILVKDEEKKEFLDYNFSQTSYSSEFGFRTDEKGFFEKDLNKISNLPYSYDINIKSVRTIAKEWVKQNAQANYNQIDLPYVLNRYYSSLQALNPEFAEDSSIYLSRDAIAKLSQAFSTQDGTLKTKISRIYENQEELNTALDNTKKINTLMLDNKIVNFHFDKALNNTSSNEILKPYLTRNSEVSKSGLLMNFIYHDIKNQNEDEFNFFMKPVSLDSQAHINFYNILDGEQNIEDFLKQNNEKKMSFDLYLYVNGVDKRTISRDKLSVFFQQYVNYQKDMDLKEFTNSSSIFELYTKKIEEDFNKMKEDYKTQSEDKQRLENVNLKRDSSTQNFLNHRQRQMNLNKILNSYLNVMI